jgi:hypothetical protein
MTIFPALFSVIGSLPGTGKNVPLLTPLLTPPFQADDCVVNTNTYPSHLQQTMLPDLRRETLSRPNRSTTVSSP